MTRHNATLRVTLVEDASARTASSTSFLNPDGSTSVEITESPTRVRQDGEYVDIDPTLAAEDGVLKPAASTAAVEISPGGSATNAPLTEISKGSKSLALDWPTDLPKATVDGAVATFDAGTKDIRVTATDNGFNVHVVLHKAPSAAPVYTLPITAVGVTVRELSDGSFAATDATGKVTFTIAAPRMWDSNPATMTEGDPSAFEPVNAELITQADGTQALQLTPSMTWLSDNARVWPVIVDPDVYGVLGGDTTIKGSAPDSSFWSEQTVHVGYASGGWNRTLMRFDIPAAAAGKYISAATMSLYQWNAGSCSPKSMTIYRNTTARPDPMTWSASTTPTPDEPKVLTSSTDPKDKVVTAPFTHGNNSCSSPSTPNAWENIDLTAMATGWANGVTNYGMMLYATSETDPDAYKAFCSMNAGPDSPACPETGPNMHLPKLKITYYDMLEALYAANPPDPANGRPDTAKSWGAPVKRTFDCVITGESPPPVNCDVWFPAKMIDTISPDKPVGGYPIITFGVGSGGSPGLYAYLIEHLVRWGFVVVATKDNLNASGYNIGKAARWLAAQNTATTTAAADGLGNVKFTGMLNVNKIGAMGHSQGSGGAMNAMVNKATRLVNGVQVPYTNNIKTMINIAQPPQLACHPSPDPVPTCTNAKKITSGSFFLIGGQQDRISPNTPQESTIPSDPWQTYGQQTVRSNYEANAAEPGAAAVQRVWATLVEAGHGDVAAPAGQCDPNAPENQLAVPYKGCVTGTEQYLGYTTAWMMDRLRGDTVAHSIFVNGDGELFDQPLEGNNWAQDDGHRKSNITS